jgi:hypothetical protein
VTQDTADVGWKYTCLFITDMPELFDGDNDSLICDLASNESLNPSFLHRVLGVISFSFGDCFIFDTAMQLFG